MTDTQVLVAADQYVAQIRVVGRATFSCSQAVRDFCLGMLGGDAAVQAVVIDMSECTSMDSTFMGVLAMIGKRTRVLNSRLAIVNASDHLRGLLAELGLTRLFEFAESQNYATDWQSLNQAISQTATMTTEQQQTVLDAHEALMAIDERNIPKFQDVVDFLRHDMS